MKNLKEERLGMTKYNKQGCLMKIIEYNDSLNVVIEFQDKYKWTVKTQWSHFLSGDVKNCYSPSVCGVGISGNKYDIVCNNKCLKEYQTWRAMLWRCFDRKTKEKYPTYKNVTWLHNQENFEVWLNTDRYCLDKDILVKGNKIYSPETCCLVSTFVNSLFAGVTTSDKRKHKLPIGVYYDKKSVCHPYYTTIQKDNQSTYSQRYATPEEAFQVYKQYKETYIKQVAQEEYGKGTISKKCYEAMMRWEVEITD